MEADLVLGLALAGITLGVVEGVKPGPLLDNCNQRNFNEWF